MSLFAGFVLMVACRELGIGVPVYLAYVVPRATLGAIPPLALLMWFKFGIQVQTLPALSPPAWRCQQCSA